MTRFFGSPAPSHGTRSVSWCQAEDYRNGRTSNPEFTMTDFEKAAITAFNQHYPNATQRGCFFHFAQCLYRKMQACSLQQRYPSDADYALLMRMLTALAFALVNDVVAASDSLCDTGLFSDELQPVLDYFEDNWIPVFTLKLLRLGHRRSVQGRQRSAWKAGIAVCKTAAVSQSQWGDCMTAAVMQSSHYLEARPGIEGRTIKEWDACWTISGWSATVCWSEEIPRLCGIDVTEYLRGWAHNFNF